MPPRKRNSAGISEPQLIPSPSGRGKLLTGGKPGNKGGGRPPDEFKRRMREIATRKETEDFLDRCINGEFGPLFYFRALEFAADRGYGKPTQSITEYDFNPDDFSVTGLERVADGEDPVHVLSTGGRKQAPA
jgi:hypothetical protein